jgi:RNA polymerase sigma factor (sigma-70 family)
VQAVTSLPRPSGRAAPNFADAVEAHLDDVYSYLVYVTGNASVAEDLAAETFEKAFRKWKRYDPRRAPVKSWLCVVARGVALDHLRSEQRRRRREVVYALREPGAAEAPFLEGLSPELEGAIRELPAADREVVVLRVVLELDGPTAARILGVSETACSTRLHRALKKLEEKVRDDVRS